MQPVLVVDDDTDIRETVRMLLEDEGYMVSDAPEGRTALDALRRASASTVVLLDLNMPVMNGLQVLATLADEPALAARHRVIVVSAYSDQPLPEAVASVMREHDIPFVQKPFEVDDLLAHVARATESVRAGVRA